MSQQNMEYLHRFSWYNIILEIFEKQVLPYIMLWAIVLADSVDGEVGWHDVTHL